MDQQGLEQGGVNSSDLYKVYNNELLDTIQMSGQGVDLGGDLVVSCVGQADDVALLSNDVYSLHNSLQLTLSYCEKFHVKLCFTKTKLLNISNPNHHYLLPFYPISINGEHIPFTNTAQHVGVIRSTEGNLPHVLWRILAHKKKSW